MEKSISLYQRWYHLYFVFVYELGFYHLGETKDVLLDQVFTQVFSQLFSFMPP